MLRLGARSGYDIKRAVDVSTRFFWTISEAQIYPTLARLEEAELIVGHDASQGKRRKRAYELTPDGERALLDWLEDTGPLLFEVRDLGLLKLFFADALEDDAEALLGEMRDRSSRELENLRAQQGPASELALSSGNQFPFLSLRVGVAVHEAIIEATGEIAAEIKAR